MRKPTPEQDMIALRDHVARVLAAGCPETTRLPERAWVLVHEALVLATQAAARTKADEPARDYGQKKRAKGASAADPMQRAA